MIHKLEFNEKISVELAKTGASRKKAAMFRLGGLGDLVILTPIAKQLHKNGYDVTYYCGSPTGDVSQLFEGLPYIKEVGKLGNVQGISNEQVVEDENKNLIAKDLIKPKFDEVFDFFYSVENNHPDIQNVSGWRNTINSNFINWIDLSLGWAKIDPTTVSDEDKRPEIAINPIVYQDHIDWVNANKIIPMGARFERNSTIIGVQLQASTLIRTYYSSDELPKLIYEKYPNSIILIFGDNKWFVISKYGKREVKIPQGLNPLIISTILIKHMDCFISADSGFSHIAEAVGTKTIAVYTTVPSWTRTKYYKYIYPIDANVECSPCFTLDFFCPIRKKEALDMLTERERFILKSAEEGKSPVDVAKELNTVPGAVNAEYESAKKRIDLLSATKPACVESITHEMILNKLGALLLS
jgi:DNA-binding CsgD family transcriptional regulator